MPQLPASNRRSETNSARLWKTQEVAAYLGMSARQVRKLVDAGKLRTIRIDHHLRFDREDVDGLIEQSVAARGGMVVDQPVANHTGRSSTNRSLLTPISS